MTIFVFLPGGAIYVCQKVSNLDVKVFFYSLSILMNISGSNSLRYQWKTHSNLRKYYLSTETYQIQQNPVGSDPVGSQPHWEVILKFQKDIWDKWFYSIFYMILHNSLKWIFDKFMKVISLMKISNNQIIELQKIYLLVNSRSMFKNK